MKGRIGRAAARAAGSAPAPAMIASVISGPFGRQEVAVAGGEDEIGDLADQRAVAVFGQPAGAVLEGAFALGEGLVGGAEGGDLGPLDAATFEADEVQAVKLAARGLDEAVGDDIIGDHGDSADDGAVSDADPLVDARQAADDDIIAQLTRGPRWRHC